MDRLFLRAFAVSTLIILLGCAGVDKKIEVTNEAAETLPEVADLADPGAARIDARLLSLQEEGRQMVFHFEVLNVMAKGKVAPSLGPGRCIEVSIPRIMWLKQKQHRGQSDKPLNMTIKYQGKPRFTEAASAWRWVQFH